MSFQDLLEQPFGTISELIALAARERPTHPALIQDDRALDFSGLDRLMDRVAAGLARAGVGTGQTIAICAATSIAYAAVFLGAVRAGVAVAPLAPSSSDESLALMIADCGARLVFVDAAASRALSSREREQDGVGRIALDGGGHATSVEARESAREQNLDDFLANEGSTPPTTAIAPDAPFNIIYSSGTTGTPKGIVQPHRMRWAHVRRGQDSGYGPDSVTLISTPLYSNTTLVSFFPGIALGGTVVLMAKFDAAKFLALSQRHRVTHAMLVPVQYDRVMAAPELAAADLSSYRMKFCTSAPFSAALKQRVLERWPGGLLEYYGMTEGGGTCVLAAHLFPDKLHTVGKPAPEHDVRLIDEQGREVAQGEVGEVVGWSPLAVMTGYHGQAEKTAEAEWFSDDGRRFIRTGDVGRFDQDGFLTLLDRKKDMIISGGFNVYPSDLEAVLAQHPAVREVAVVGVSSQQWGETPVAFVVRTPGESVGAAQLMGFLNERVGKTQRLSALRLVDSLPRSPIGKVLKRELRAAYERELGDVSPKSRA
jgi:acyl-CoA synthetase (AMP-forming)/AMP-acid ligase II